MANISPTFMKLFDAYSQPGMPLYHEITPTEKAIKELQSAFSKSTTQQAPQQTQSNNVINPYYMQDQSNNSLAPMQAYQQYKDNGTIPTNASGFNSYAPFTPPQQTQTQYPAISSGTNFTQVGGK